MVDEPIPPTLDPEQAVNRPPRFGIPLILGVIIVLLLGANVAHRLRSRRDGVGQRVADRSAHSARDLPKDFATIPDFSLTDQNGKQVTRRDLLGSTTIVGFIFTRCLGTCPMVTGTMARLQKELPADVKLVSLSVDPTHDTPAVLKEYADKTQADPERWRFLTGDEEAMYRLIRDGFKVGVMVNPNPSEGELITHTTRLALLDADGNIRGYYDSGDAVAIDALIARLTKQQKERP